MKKFILLTSICAGMLMTGTKASALIINIKKDDHPTDRRTMPEGYNFKKLFDTEERIRSKFRLTTEDRIVFLWNGVEVDKNKSALELVDPRGCCDAGLRQAMLESIEFDVIISSSAKRVAPPVVSVTPAPAPSAAKSPASDKVKFKIEVDGANCEKFFPENLTLEEMIVRIRGIMIKPLGEKKISSIRNANNEELLGSNTVAGDFPTLPTDPSVRIIRITTKGYEAQNPSSARKVSSTRKPPAPPPTVYVTPAPSGRKQPAPAPMPSPSAKNPAMPTSSVEQQACVTVHYAFFDQSSSAGTLTIPSNNSESLTANVADLLNIDLIKFQIVFTSGGKSIDGDSTVDSIGHEKIYAVIELKPVNPLYQTFRPSNQFPVSPSRSFGRTQLFGSKLHQPPSNARALFLKNLNHPEKQPLSNMLGGPQALSKQTNQIIITLTLDDSLFGEGPLGGIAGTLNSSLEQFKMRQGRKGTHLKLVIRNQQGECVEVDAKFATTLTLDDVARVLESIEPDPKRRIEFQQPGKVLPRNMNFEGLDPKKELLVKNTRSLIVFCDFPDGTQSYVLLSVRGGVLTAKEEAKKRKLPTGTSLEEGMNREKPDKRLRARFTTLYGIRINGDAVTTKEVFEKFGQVSAKLDYPQSVAQQIKNDKSARAVEEQQQVILPARKDVPPPSSRLFSVMLPLKLEHGGSVLLRGAFIGPGSDQRNPFQLVPVNRFPSALYHYLAKSSKHCTVSRVLSHLSDGDQLVLLGDEIVKDIFSKFTSREGREQFIAYLFRLGASPAVIQELFGDN